MEKKDMICIVCPRGCKMTATKLDDGKIVVEGNSCKKGLNFAIDELTIPTRTLTTTVETIFTEMPFLPVRTNREVPKSKLDEIISILRNFKLICHVNCGDIIIQNIAKTGCDIIATSDI